MNGLANVKIPEPPPGEFFRIVRNVLVQVVAALVPPGMVTNFRVTALAGANQVDFTRSDGDSYVLYWNTTASINGAVRIDLGNANKYVDSVGDGSITRFYSVKPKKGTVSGPLSSWLSQTTLALGTAVTPPEPPPATDIPFTDSETDAVEVPYTSGGGLTQF